MERKKTISRAELRAMLFKFQGVTFSHLVAFTDEYGSRVVKGARQLQKLTFRNITIGSDYTKRVNRRLEKQDEIADFVSEAMSGKHFVEGSNVLAAADKNVAKEYLVCDQELKAKTRITYFHQGKKISKEQAIAQNLFAPSFFTEKKTAGRGQVDADNNFFRLTIGLDNIIAITLNKVHYIIED
jgi:hypothetical protein